jgi:hypothetical protein
MKAQGNNIVAAYSNSILHHEIYIKDPKVTGEKVWKLVKALYGLKLYLSIYLFIQVYCPYVTIWL